MLGAESAAGIFCAVCGKPEDEVASALPSDRKFMAENEIASLFSRRNLILPQIKLHVDFIGVQAVCKLLGRCDIIFHIAEIDCKRVVLRINGHLVF
ncbi:hypothetical protein SDC9_110794 [bioreactor metagenome]|uniref:Uncharacterized protein n=1 Tax=bioreactor metagenome TaxID=1076179 RepID=A0A645BEP0_9ZZZZ